MANSIPYANITFKALLDHQTFEAFTCHGLRIVQVELLDDQQSELRLASPFKADVVKVSMQFSAPSKLLECPQYPSQILLHPDISQVSCRKNRKALEKDDVRAITSALLKHICFFDEDGNLYQLRKRLPSNYRCYRNKAGAIQAAIVRRDRLAAKLGPLLEEAKTLEKAISRISTRYQLAPLDKIVADKLYAFRLEQLQKKDP